jgi:hydrogenase maturation protein HypF
MAEKRLYERNIAFTFDGTGYGDDGETWGGEVLVCDPRAYRRAFHLEYVPLPGGDRAAEEPWRMALAYLMHNGLDHQPYVREEQAANVAAMLRSGARALRTSSMGRLFDAVSSLCGLCRYQTYEGKAPMALEGVVEDSSDAYGFSLNGDEITTGELIRGVVRDLDARVPVPIISGRFHNTIVRIMVECARALRDSEGLNRVFLSGGCFVNGYLVARGRRALEAEGFQVFTHSLLPPNDGGISAGQLLVAACGGGIRQQ